MILDLKNETEEDIVIPAGEVLRIRGHRNQHKGMVGHRKVFNIRKTGNDPMDAVTRVECEDCGDMVPVDVMDLGAHEC